RYLNSAAPSVEPELAVDSPYLRRLDQPRVSNCNGMQRSFERAHPEAEEFLKGREPWAQIILLPDVGLQQRGMIRQTVENLGRGQPIALELPLEILRDLRNHERSPSSHPDNVMQQTHPRQAKNKNKCL